MLGEHVYRSGCEEESSRRSWLKKVACFTGATWLGSYVPSFAWGQGENKSVQLHIYLETKPNKGAELESLFHTAYFPAIQVQDGFLAAKLLRQYDSTTKYEIDISFKTEKQRAAWAKSKEHQATWPKVEAVSAKITWQGFDVLA